MRLVLVFLMAFGLSAEIVHENGIVRWVFNEETFAPETLAWDGYRIFFDQEHSVCSRVLLLNIAGIERDSANTGDFITLNGSEGYFEKNYSFCIIRRCKFDCR